MNVIGFHLSVFAVVFLAMGVSQFVANVVSDYRRKLTNRSERSRPRSPTGLCCSTLPAPNTFTDPSTASHLARGA